MGRGNPMKRRDSPGIDRSIPAWRGNRFRGARRRHPGGSIPAWAGQPQVQFGEPALPSVYPRVGGATLSGQQLEQCGLGLSPRGRGNQPSDASQPIRSRSIPAWAGQPIARVQMLAQQEVYPRVGGATRDGFTGDADVHGLSPRGRGNHRGTTRARTGCWSIPAWAGQPSTWLVSTPWYKVYPRVGGATLDHDMGNTAGGGLSPRGRGNRADDAGAEGVRRSIPAWAGQPSIAIVPTPANGVYPRVGGATTTSVNPTVRRLRSIPAWAGNPRHHPPSLD